MNRVENLLKLIAETGITDPVILHNIVYMKEFIEGKRIGYRNCKWSITSTGVYCPELEQDLRLLAERRLVKLEVSNSPHGRTLYVIAKKTMEHYIENILGAPSIHR